MKTITLCALVLFTMVACKKNSNIENDSNIKNSTISEGNKTSVLETGCYEYSGNGSLIGMEITAINDNVTANLNFAFAKKDKNQGKFVGKLLGDKIIGTYTFMSEGKESSREVAFMFKDNQLIEGFGVLNEDGTKFKEIKTIQYQSQMPLVKVDCHD